MREVIAHWREAGRWWDGEPEREIVRHLDGKGAVVEEVAELACPHSRRSEGSSLPASLRGCWGDDPQAHTVDYDVLKLEDRQARKDINGIVKMLRESISDGDVLQSTTAIRHSSIVPLHCISALSFGRSSLTPEQIAALAFVNGMGAVAITDYFSLSGVVAFAKAAKSMGVKPIIGATLEMEGGGEIVLLVANHTGYRNLSRLITRCHLDEPRLFPLCNFDRLREYSDGLICLTGGHTGPINRLLVGKRLKEAKNYLRELRAIFGERLYVEIEYSFTPHEMYVNRHLTDISRDLGIRQVAGGAITHWTRDEFPVQDALLCVETLCTVEELIGRKPQRHKSQQQITPWPERAINSERYFRSTEEWMALFEPELLTESQRIADMLPDDPLPPRPAFPVFCDNSDALLRVKASKGAIQRFGRVPPKVKKELDRICDLGFSSHFLAIWEACQWARSEGVLYSARGSVVDSAVAFCLGLSRIDAIEHNLHFDRFLPSDGSKRPDIDIDFEANRRDDVRSFFSKRYGKDHVATVCAISTYQGRGIVRAVGKALMIPEDALGYLAKRLHGSVSGRRLSKAIETRPELRDSGIPAERFQVLFELAQRIDGLPKHIGAHSSGVVISATPICDTVPVMESGREGVPIMQWDKYSSKKYFDKFDILCLRGQGVLAGTQRRVRERASSYASTHAAKSEIENRKSETPPPGPLPISPSSKQEGGVDFHVEDIPLDDDSVFEEFRKGRLVGTPQSASPAMRQAHVRLQTRNLHDTSLIQAGIRPGVGGAVKLNALIRRRRGLEIYVYPHPLLEEILGTSYGVIVFQEQVDQLLQAFGGYSSGEAEEIREGIHKRREDEWAESICKDITERCLQNGFDREIAEHVVELVSGFKGYGFAQGHALAFADMSIRSVYCQQHFPAEYFAALLSAQPAGYYGPGTIANEARLRGVALLPLDINRSDEKFTVEEGKVRIGLMQQFGLSKPTLKRIIETRPFRSIFDFCARAKPEVDEVENLILSGAFDSLHPNRRALLWIMPEAQKYAKGEKFGELFEDHPEPQIPEDVKDFSEYERAVLERSMLSLDINTHLMAFERGRIKSRGGITCAEASELEPETEAVVVGKAMRLRFPPTASGRRVVFFDLEDESGMLNVTCFDDTYEKDGQAIICSPYVTLKGVAQDRDGYIAFLAKRVFAYKPTVDREGFAEERKAVEAGDFIHKRGR